MLAAIQQNLFDVAKQNLFKFAKQNLFDVAKQKRNSCVQVAKIWNEFVKTLNDKKLILAPWCDEKDVEKDVKAQTKGEMGASKTLCCPFEQPELLEGMLSSATRKLSKIWSYWGWSY
ncbi:unnamed protein product [Cuscuta europaea]|uniref:Proline-tRNA ligase class II C-terminal domain-containing protein n=1 Tax=Cuscuta europaea TaxID=41803 RepID=A0A9P0ZI58_CUSEU|nr:unnamed protein product [Cuscuta europaea]